MDWIPCTERLPEENVPVLICSEKRYKNDISFNLITVGWLERFDWGGTDFFSYDDMWNHGKVIAWMPLPQPYKAE